MAFLIQFVEQVLDDAISSDSEDEWLEDAVVSDNNPVLSENDNQNNIRWEDTVDAMTNIPFQKKISCLLNHQVTNHTIGLDCWSMKNCWK